MTGPDEIADELVGTLPLGGLFALAGSFHHFCCAQRSEAANSGIVVTAGFRVTSLSVCVGCCCGRDPALHGAMQKSDGVICEQPLFVVHEKPEFSSFLRAHDDSCPAKDGIATDKFEDVLVENVKHKLSFEETPEVIRRTKKKRLRFATAESEIVGTISSREDMTAEEIRNMWWSTPEFNGIRLGAKFVTKDVRSRDKSLVEGIEEAYARALHLACSLSDDDFAYLMANCKDQAVYLLPWCERTLSARGLERYTSRKHRYDRTEYAQETRAAALRLAPNSRILFLPCV